MYGHLLGSILHYMCWKDGPGMHQTVSPCKRLALIFTRIQEHYKDLGSPTRLTNLKLSMFTKEKSPHATYPFLTAKGAECKHLGPALKRVVDEVSNIASPLERSMVHVLDNIVPVPKNHLTLPTKREGCRWGWAGW